MTSTPTAATMDAFRAPSLARPRATARASRTSGQATRRMSRSGRAYVASPPVLAGADGRVGVGPEKACGIGDTRRARDVSGRGWKSGFLPALPHQILPAGLLAAAIVMVR